jgi:GT2 family glycosyltransferase
VTRPPVTVVVPTVDRPALLARCLDALAGQDWSGEWSALVVHESDARVDSLLRGRRCGGKPVGGLRCNERSAAGKRNAGAAAAGTELVAFTDDDCVPSPSWLGALVRAFDEETVDVVAGPVLPDPGDPPGGPFARTVDQPSDIDLYAGANLALRREAFDRAGGFDVTLSSGEDTDLVWRVREAGGRFGWAADALVWHAVRPLSFTAHLRSLPRWAALPEIVRRHPLLRSRVHRHWFWKASHPPACVAAIGLLATPFQPLAALAAVPLLARRVRLDGPVAGPALAAADLAEVAVLAYGSLRHRTILL